MPLPDFFSPVKPDKTGKVNIRLCGVTAFNVAENEKSMNNVLPICLYLPVALAVVNVPETGAIVGVYEVQES